MRYLNTGNGNTGSIQSPPLSVAEHLGKHRQHRELHQRAQHQGEGDERTIRKRHDGDAQLSNLALSSASRSALRLTQRSVVASVSGMSSTTTIASTRESKDTLAGADVPAAGIDSGAMTELADQTIKMFGADWCRDCRRTKAQLDELGVAYTYIDLVAEPDAADVARDISGRTNIPVVLYPDATHQVEPSNADVETKLRELNLI